MGKKSPYIELAECLLPEDMVECFEVVKVEKTTETLDVTLEERDNGVAGFAEGRNRGSADISGLRQELFSHKARPV